MDSRNGNYIYLKDIARIEDSTTERRSEYRFNGESSIGIQIIKRQEANTVEVVDKVKKKFDELAERYPYITFTKADDDSIYTTQVVGNMSESVRDALIFTSLIILFFLIALNESIIVASSMPLSLLATFALMKMSGMALNMVTLSAIILAVGIVVDDAIIVVENIMRHHHELGKDLKTAAIEGTREIISFTTVNLTSRKERDETIWQIEERLRGKIAQMPGIETFVVKETGGTAKSTTLAPIDVRIYGKDPKVLAYLAGEVEDKLKNVKGVVNVYKRWSLNTPEADVHVNETRAARFGLSAAGVAKELFNSLEGARASTFSQENIKDADIQVRYREQDRRSIEDLMNVSVTSPTGLRVPLRDVASVELVRGSNLVTRENLQRSIDVLGYTYERPLSHVTADVEKSVKEIKMPEGYRVEVAGEQSDLSDSKGDMMFSLLLAIILVYLLLVAQFRSFIHPVTIMLAVPLVVIGVALALLFSGKTISLPALLGLILLVGMVVRNSIVLLDYTLQARAKGVERNRAVVDSVKIRFRPIMMTAFSNVIAMLPLALEFALGAERFSPLAITVIGGITAATLLTMVVIPVAYTVLDDLASAVTGVGKTKINRKVW